MSEISKELEKSKELLNNLSKYDKVLYDAVVDIISDSIKDGKIKLSNKELAQLEEKILEYLKDSNYSKDVSKYFDIFQNIANLNMDRQIAINDLKLSKINAMWNANEQKTLLEQKTLYYLKGNGLKTKYAQAVGDLIREQHFLGKDFNSAKKILKQSLVEKSITQRYINTTVIDSMRTYNGIFNDTIRETYGFKNYKYVGDILETSRPFCIILVEKYKGNITENQMKDVLNEYCPNGKPSQTKITIDGKVYKKGAGMYEDTTIENICTNCGGFGCLHDCYPTK